MKEKLCFSREMTGARMSQAHVMSPTATTSSALLLRTPASVFIITILLTTVPATDAATKGLMLFPNMEFTTILSKYVLVDLGLDHSCNPIEDPLQILVDSCC